MNQVPYYGCSGGCANCPRRDACNAAGTPEPATAAGGSFAADSAADGSIDGFLLANPDKGILRIQAFRGDQSIPVENVRVTISRSLGGKDHIFFTGSTNASGIIDPIVLPAPSRTLSMQPGDVQPYAVYQLRAEHPLFVPLVTTVDVYQNIKTVQPVQLHLKTG